MNTVSFISPSLDVPTLPMADKHVRRFWLTLLASLVVHLALAVWIPNLRFDPVEKPPVIEVELLPPKPPEPPPLVQPEPPKPQEPPNVTPKELLKPVPPQPKVIPKPVVPEVVPTQAAEPPPTPVEQAPAVIAVTPSKVEPVLTAPPPPVVQEVQAPVVSQEDIDAARARYVGTLQRAIAKHKQYPKMAQMRGWQGEALLDLHIDSNGSVLSSEIHTSSGYEILDKQALEMVKKASPFPTPPDVLKGRTFNITVPVAFKLE